MNITYTSPSHSNGQTPVPNDFSNAGSPSQTERSEGSPAAIGADASLHPSNSRSGAGAARSKSATPQATAKPPTACTACREKHLKCDGQQPCSRCKDDPAGCKFVASRRGYKVFGNKRRARSPPPSGESPAICPGVGSFMGAVAAPAPLQTRLGQEEPKGTLVGWNASLARVSSSSPVAERCIRAFYACFYPGHPFVLPWDFLQPKIAEFDCGALLAAMRWIGSMYEPSLDDATRQELKREAVQLQETTTKKDGFFLQAMMILIVGLDGTCAQEEAKHLLMKAEMLALTLQINTSSYATTHGMAIPVLEESWRRTWWDLFMVDGMIAGVHQATNFALYDIATDVPLPCEELEYLSGLIPTPKTLEQLEDLEFTDEALEFSSFSYRILCGKYLGRFMRLMPIQGPDDENLNRVETLLTNWRLHLPASKQDAMRPDGHPDEMMFQAHMMLNATSLLLHQQHSQLDTSPAKTVTSCAPYRPVATGQEMFNIHTHHTLIAANNISKLITRGGLLGHTHFFTCVITLSSIVHLSRWAQHFYLPQASSSSLVAPAPYRDSIGQGVDDDLRQLIRLNIGALSQLSSVWGAAQRARGQVKGVASEIYRTKKQLQLNASYWAGFSSQEMVNSIAADDTIISEIQTLLPLPDMPKHVG